MDTVIAGAALAPVVDGHEVTDDHIHIELARSVMADLGI
jgi:hypothetical protein